MQLTEEFKDLCNMSMLLSLSLFVSSAALWYLYTEGNMKKWIAELTTVLFATSMVVSLILGGTYTQPSRVSLSNVPHKDTVKTIYANNIDAAVHYMADGNIFTGGKHMNETESKSEVFYRVYPKHNDNTLIVTKNAASVTKKVNTYELIGDTTGTIDKIEYGTREWYLENFGMKTASKKDKLVKIYFKKDKSKDKKELEKLLSEN
jgi:hypothetical protein